MDTNLFDTNEMEALLNQLNAENIKKADKEMEEKVSMSKEMEASQRRYEEIIKKHQN